jgi:hypothetical protein
VLATPFILNSAASALALVACMVHEVAKALAALSCLDVRPLIKGYFSALRWSGLLNSFLPMAIRGELSFPQGIPC